MMTTSGRPARPFTIGIAWQGNPGNNVDRCAFVPARSLRPPRQRARSPSAQPAEGRRNRADRRGGRTISAWPNCSTRATAKKTRRDFLDTAAVMTQLDLVVTPDTSVAHLAGGLGVPVWLVLPYAAEWRWLIDRDDSPWYPSMRLFRQTALPGLGWGVCADGSGPDATPLIPMTSNVRAAGLRRRSGRRSRRPERRARADPGGKRLASHNRRPRA